jgi:hypothetical protein
MFTRMSLCFAGLRRLSQQNKCSPLTTLQRGQATAANQRLLLGGRLMYLLQPPWPQDEAHQPNV